MLKNIQHAREDKADILDKLQNISSHRIPSSGFGVGNSTELFFEVLKREDIWNLDIQKIFVDIRGLKRRKKHFALEIFALEMTSAHLLFRRLELIMRAVFWWRKKWCRQHTVPAHG